MDDLALAPEQLLAHAGFVRRLARALVRDEHGTDDVVQDTWAAALASPPRRGGPLRPWLATLANNFARRRWRSDARRAARERAAARTERLPSTATTLERNETLRLVTEAVLALPEPYRSTVQQRFYEGLPPRVIAARTHVPVETVNTRLRRALAQLRENLAARNPRDPDQWRMALLAFAGGGRKVLGLPLAAHLSGVAFLLMKIKLFVAATAVLAAAGGLFVLLDQPAPPAMGDATARAAASVAPAPAPGNEDAAADAANAPSPVAATDRHEMAPPEPAAPAADNEDLDSVPERIDVPIRVLDTAGNPVPSAHVELWATPETLPMREFWRKHEGYSLRRSGTEPLFRTTTNAAGRCVVTVDQQPLIVRAAHPIAGASCEVAWNHRHARTAAELALTLEPLVPIRVLVLRGNGEPAAGVTVSARMVGGKMETPSEPPPATTNPDGRCEFALQPGFYFRLHAQDGDARSLFGRARTVSASEPIDVVLRFPGAMTIHGTLRAADGTPVADGSVQLWEHQTPAQREANPFAAYCKSATADATGEYALDVPHPGSFDLIGAASGHANSAVHTVEVTTAEPHVRADVKLTRPASIVGRVVREGGEPVVGAILYARMSVRDPGYSGHWSEIGPPDVFGRDTVTAKSAADGAFRFDGLHPRATYTLECVPYPRQAAARVTRKDVVPGGEVQFVITDRDLRTGCIAGTVVAASTGAPITRFQLWIVEYEAGEGWVPMNERDLNDAAGAFRSPPFAFGLRRAVAIATDDHAPALAGPVTISQDEHRFEVRLPDFGVVAVRVVEADGSPARNAKIDLRMLDGIPRNRAWSQQRTDDDGRFSWRKVPPGRYRVIAERDPEHRTQVECDVRSGQTTPVELRLPR